MGRLRGAAEAFEAMLVSSLVRSMREAQLEGGLFGEGPGAEIYEEMFTQNLSESLARGSFLGVARSLEDQWIAGSKGQVSAGEADRVTAGESRREVSRDED